MSNFGSKIGAISYYTPSRVLRNQDLEKLFPDLSASKIETKLGIKQRNIAEDNETSVDLAIKVGTKLFTENKKIQKDEIDYLILVTQSPDYILPTSACLIQQRLGLKKSIGAIDINLGCSGFVYALNLAKGIIATKTAKKVLIITSETYSKFIEKTDRSTMTIFGDAACATLIESSKTQQIGDFILGTDGSGAPNLIIKNGGARAYESKPQLYMNGPEIQQFTLEVIPSLLDDFLIKINKKLHEIDNFIFHQANSHIVSLLRRACKIPEEKVYIDIELIGNTVSSTIPIALKRAKELGKVKQGDLVILIGFGVGYSWGICDITI